MPILGILCYNGSLVTPHHAALHINKMRYVDNEQLEFQQIVESSCPNICGYGSYARNLNRDRQLHNFQTKTYGSEKPAACKHHLS
jgi:hypothetical protein